MFWRSSSALILLLLATACGANGPGTQKDAEVLAEEQQEVLGSENYNISTQATDGIDQANIGTFNLLRLTTDNKNFQRMVGLIDQSQLHLFAGIEIMSEDAAHNLLNALNRYSNQEWAMSLSKVQTGETRYKEWFAYYYQTRYIREYNSTTKYCASEDAVDRIRNVCFVRDTRENGPDFDRDPFVGHFWIGKKRFTLIAVHLYYGSREAESIARRQHELAQLRQATDRVKEASKDTDVLLVGDFNLALAENSYEGETVAEESASKPSRIQIPVEFMAQAPALSGIVAESTTIGRSNFDHIFFFEGNRSTLLDEGFGSIIDFNPESRVQKDRYKSEVSDHYPVIAKFLL